MADNSTSWQNWTKRCLLKRTTKPRNKGLVKLLLSCPVKDWFQPLERTETTYDIKLPKLG